MILGDLNYFFCTNSLKAFKGTSIRALRVFYILNTKCSLKLVSPIYRNEIVHETHFGPSFKRKFSILFWVFFIFRNFRNKNIRTAYCITPFSSFMLVFMRYFNYLNVETIVTEIHGLYEYEHANSKMVLKKFLSFIEYVVIKKSDVLILMSNSAKSNLLYKYSVDPNKVRVCWPPSNPNIKYIEPVNSEIFTVCYTGSIQFYQGLNSLLDLIKFYKDSKDIRFLIISKGMQGVFTANNVQYFEELEFDAYMNIMASSHLFLSLRSECIASEMQVPQKLSDYFSVGRPILATDVSDQRQLIELFNSGFVLNKNYTTSELIQSVEIVKQLYYCDFEKYLNYCQMSRKTSDVYLSDDKFIYSLKDIL